MKIFLKDGVGYYCYYGENGEHLYYHRLVAEQKIGRPLLEEECVHHIDRNKLNNHPSNLMVFKTGADHSRHHRYPNIELLDNGDGTFSFPVDTLKIECINCGNLTLNHKYCSKECVKYAKEESMFMDTDELEILLRTKSFVEVAKKYNISDNGLRKRLRKLGLPTTKMEKIEYYNLPHYTDLEIFNLYKQGTTVDTISKTTSISKTSIYNIIRKYKNNIE